MSTVYVAIAVDDDLRVRECVVVSTLSLAKELEDILQKTWGASHICLASRAVDEIPTNLIEAMMPPEEPIEPPEDGWIGGGRHG